MSGEGVAPDALRLTAEVLKKFEVPCREITHAEVGAAPDASAGAALIIVASADVELPARLATGGVPVIRVPVEASHSPDKGAALLAGGEGFATVALGHAGATNAALLAVAMLAARGDEPLRQAWADYRQAQTEGVLSQTLPAV